jgi:mono/diheme cytochrome c family protein
LAVIYTSFAMTMRVRRLSLFGLVAACATALVVHSGAVSEAEVPHDPVGQRPPHAGGAGLRGAGLHAPPQFLPTQATVATNTTSVAAALNQYCVTCHSERLKTAGFVVDTATLGNVGPSAEAWEKVVRKLRARAMPPVTAPRPDEATYDAVSSFLEVALDRAEAARPHLGTLPLVHRLTRTEYQNAIRDLLALESLPRELRIDFLLPEDNISSGFDNIADLLFVSPSNMERYLDAARKISRIAVGDPTMPVLVNIHRLGAEHPQDERVEDLPFGTRGGLAVRSEFPVDGTYVVDVDLAGASRDRHDLEITVDGERVALRTLGGEAGGGRGRGRGAAAEPLEFRIPLKAGPKLIGVSFVQRSEARDEATLRPRMRSRGTQPAIATVTISGPYDAIGPGDSPSRRRIFTCRPTAPSDEAACARRILSSLARRAYRRPVSDVDLRDLTPFYEAGRKEGSFDRGIQKALERLLVSSQFLFRIERPPADGTPGVAYRVSDLDLASRLSFFLWSSIPDDELLDVAVAGKLKDPTVLEAQVRRMLADRRSEALVANFAAQWLYLRDLDAKRPDEILFADFDETLRQALRRETDLFIDSVFRPSADAQGASSDVEGREKRSVLELLTANYTFLNERLARHYGIPGIKGSHFRRVSLPPGSVRGGLLGQGSVLTITSYSTRTSPVLRGKWVLENLLASAPPPPPADIPSLDTEGPDREKPPTLREAMTRHRASPACASCHARMDPIGFAMENFDAIGRWRDRDAGNHPIDASGTFPEGTTFTGMGGLKQELLRRPEQFVGTVTEKLLMYAIGRNLQYYDAPSVRAIVREARPGTYSFSSIVLGVVKSRPFQMREAS